MKILIIEDNEINMKLARDVLVQGGYSVLTACDGLRGLEVAQKQLPDLILMDIQLPGIDGVTATNVLRSDPQTKQIKIIALTAFAMRGDEEKFLGNGFDGYISKPFKYKELLEMVRSFEARGIKDKDKR